MLDTNYSTIIGNSMGKRRRYCVIALLFIYKSCSYRVMQAHQPVQGGGRALSIVIKVNDIFHDGLVSA